LSSYTRRLRTAFADLPPEKILIPPDFRSKPSPILELTARTTCSSVPARHAGINELLWSLPDCMDNKQNGGVDRLMWPIRPVAQLIAIDVVQFGALHKL
jgi:hypothetical protein